MQSREDFGKEGARVSAERNVGQGGRSLKQAGRAGRLPSGCFVHRVEGMGQIPAATYHLVLLAPGLSPSSMTII